MVLGSNTSGHIFDTTFNADGVLYADASGIVNSTTVGTATHVLTSNGAGLAPTFQSIAGSGAITTITGNTGGAESPSAGNFNILGTGSITIAGTANTETVQLTGLTNHNILVGAGTATITKVAPSATSGIPLISQGAAADPTFGTAVVAGGGTGATTLTGVLTGNGTSAITASTVTQHGVLVGGASNAVASTAVGTTGQVLQANTGADPTYSTATFPSTATSTGTILRADGTNWVATTATYPSTTGANTMLISTSANVVTTTTFIAATSYTPVLAFGGGSTGITYSTQLGRYTQIGNMVTFTADITLSSKGSSTGIATITLPVTSAAGVPTIELFAAVFVLTITGSYTTLDITASATTGTLVSVVATTGAPTAITDTAFTNSSVIRITGSYWV